jgi:chromosomal replication initiator protein
MPTRRESLVSQQQLDETWAHVENRLRDVFPESVYQIWLAALRPVALTHSTLYVEAPAETRDWVSRRFGSALVDAASEADPAVHRIELVDPASSVASRPDRGPRATQQAFPSGCPLKPTHTFERFVIGSCNRFAHAAALTVAELPAQAYDPLLIYGPTGVGKTHLLQAIANYLHAYDRRLTVLYTTGETFTSQFLFALQRSDLSAFKHRYRTADVMIFDDAEFLQGKQRTGEELLHTLDELSSSGAQAILASSSHPSKIDGLDGRLRDRFQSGLMVDMEPPDLHTRRTLLRKLASSSSRVLDDTVVDRIADRVPRNFHILEGTFVRMTAFASLTGSELTIELAERVLTSMPETATENGRTPAPPITVSRIQHETASVLGVEIEELRSPRRRRRLVYARQVAMYLARELTSLSLPAIAQQFGGRDHTTVLHAHRKIKSELLTDSGCRSLVSSLTERLTTNPQVIPQAGT